MGVHFSCPLAQYSDLESAIESVVVKSISFGDEASKTTTRSISFNDKNSDPTILKSVGSGKLVLEGSVSFRRREKETIISIEASASPLDRQLDASFKSISFENNDIDLQFLGSDGSMGSVPDLPMGNHISCKHEAALKLQKVYKSFRTRRKLADCAVLVEQSWWKLLDFAELKRTSISFFDIEKHETAISRWSRARTKAAKVGKGLSKSDKAQKLALQHWLEAIDPRHRYGHNLHFYYGKWLHCQSREPFFYWLDIGEGKEVNLVDKCPRFKLQQQCIKYLGPMEREAYEVIVEDGKLFYKQTGELLDTAGHQQDAKWIFVLSTSKTLYAGKKRKGMFQHSSFLAGGATSAAGRLVVEKGVLKAVWPHSGHYRPTEENFQEFVSFLLENNVDLSEVKMASVDMEGEAPTRQSSIVCLRSSFSEEDLPRKEVGLEAKEINGKNLTKERTDSMEEESAASLKHQKSTCLENLHTRLTNLKMPKRVEPIEGEEHSFDSGQEYKVQFGEEQNEHEIESVAEESILRRINSHKETKSYQLGKQLSLKWTTGAGPRIGCVRDYPSELQFRALEQVNLSPRSAARLGSYFSPRKASGLSPKVSTPTSLFGETAAAFNPQIIKSCRALSSSSPLLRSLSASRSTKL